MNHCIFTIIYFHKATEGSLLTAKKKDSRRRTRAAWVSFTCPISISKTRCYQAYDQPKCLATKLSIFSQEKKNLSSAVLVYNGYSFSSVEAYRDKNSLGQSSFRSQDRSLESPVWIGLREVYAQNSMAGKSSNSLQNRKNTGFCRIWFFSSSTICG